MHLRCAAITLFSLQMASYFKGLNNSIEVESAMQLPNLLGFLLNRKEV